MLPRPVVPVFLRQPKVYQEELVAVSPNPHQEVVGLDVAVDEVLVVDILDPPDHLVGQHEDGLHGEPPGAEVEEVLKAWAKEVHNKHIVVPLLSIPPYVWYPYSSLQDKIVRSTISDQQLIAVLYCQAIAFSNIKGKEHFEAEFFE